MTYGQRTILLFIFLLVALIPWGWSREHLVGCAPPSPSTGAGPTVTKRFKNHDEMKDFIVEIYKTRFQHAITKGDISLDPPDWSTPASAEKKDGGNCYLINKKDPGYSNICTAFEVANLPAHLPKYCCIPTSVPIKREIYAPCMATCPKDTLQKPCLVQPTGAPTKPSGVSGDGTVSSGAPVDFEQIFGGLGKASPPSTGKYAKCHLAGVDYGAYDEACVAKFGPGFGMQAIYDQGCPPGQRKPLCSRAYLTGRPLYNTLSTDCLKYNLTGTYPNTGKVAKGLLASCQDYFGASTTLKGVTTVGCPAPNYIRGICSSSSV